MRVAGHKPSISCRSYQSFRRAVNGDADDETNIQVEQES
jgi:hypothetical protein